MKYVYCLIACLIAFSILGCGLLTAALFAELRPDWGHSWHILSGLVASLTVGILQYGGGIRNLVTGVMKDLEEIRQLKEKRNRGRGGLIVVNLHEEYKKLVEPLIAKATRHE